MTETSDIAPAPEAAPSVGVRLSQARQSQGLSLGEMARQLKLSVKQVEALERDDYSNFPGALWVRGFLRNYAKALGLNPETLIEKAGLAGETPGQTPAVAGTPMPAQANKERRRNLMVTVAFILLGLIVLGLLGQRASRQGTGESSAPVVPKGSVSVPSATPSTSPPPPPPSPIDLNAPATLPPEPAPTPAAPASGDAGPASGSSPAPAASPTTPAGPVTPPVPGAPSATPSGIPPSAPPSSGTSAMPAAPAQVGSASASAPAAAVATVAAASAATATVLQSSTTVSGPAPASGSIPEDSKPADGASGQAVKPEEPVKPRTVRFTFTQSVDIEVRDANGKVLLKGLQAAGTEKAARGLPPLSVSVGNVHAVTIVYRGREVDLTSRGRTGSAKVALK